MDRWAGSRSVPAQRRSAELEGGANSTPLYITQLGRVLRDAWELPDEEVVVVGSFSEIGRQARPFLARLNMDGSVDTSVPAVTSEFHDGFEEGGPLLLSVAADSAGRIYVAGRFTKINGVPRPGLARLNSCPDWNCSAIAAFGAAGLLDLSPPNILQ